MNTYIIDHQNSVLSWEEEFDGSSNHKDVEVEGGKIFTELGKIVGGFAELDFSTFLQQDKEVDDKKEFDVSSFLKNDDIIKGKNLESVEYKIEEVLIRPHRKDIRGLLKVNNRAFSFSFPAEIDIDEKKITLNSEFHLSDVNPEWRSEIEKSGSNSLKDVKLKFNLVATSQQL